MNSRESALYAQANDKYGRVFYSTYYTRSNNLITVSIKRYIEKFRYNHKH
jgi:hypothetical protein